MDGRRIGGALQYGQYPNIRRKPNGYNMDDKDKARRGIILLSITTINQLKISNLKRLPKQVWILQWAVK